MQAEQEKAAIVLLSGGLDSGTSLFLWLEGGGRVRLCLTVDYGQRSAREEKRAAQALARRAGLEWRQLELPWLAALGREAGSALFADGADLPPPPSDPKKLGDAASAQAVWVPARNVVLLALAAAHAEAMRASVVLTGFNREEATTFKDNSQAFVEAMDEVLSLGTLAAVRVVSPTQSMSKVEIAATALRLGLTAESFWSCYAAGPSPCGRCESCRRSRTAFAAGGT